MKIPKLFCTVNENQDLHIAIVPPEGGPNRTPVDICCVVDVSGSMGTEAKMKNQKGVEEASGLSLLDVVKHAVKTIIHSLDETDRLSLVVFTSAAKVIFEPRFMDDGGRKFALAELDKLRPLDMTNLWDGLFKGMECLRKNAGSLKDATRAVVLLTDGCPNVNPPGGHLAALRKYKDENKELVTNVHTMGFGYSLDSKILEELAVEGHGHYAFIPDASFVGTVFCNMLGNILSQITTCAQVSIEPMNGSKIVKIYGESPHQITSWGMLVHPGPIQNGQTKDIILQMSDVPENGMYVNIVVEYETTGGNKVKFELESDTRTNDVRPALTNKFRLQTTNTIRNAMEIMIQNNNSKAAMDNIEEFIEEIKKSPVATNNFVKDLIKDLSGQITQAVSRSDWFKKWGRHYLPSLSRAHLLQQCNNFKDPGVQHYGGKCFETFRDKADDTFSKLPPPKPSIKRYGSSASSSAPRSMSYFNCSSNPCFSGNSKAMMIDGSEKFVGTLRKGDKLLGGGTILLVVKTHCEGKRENLVELGTGLLITPWHPVRVQGGEWKFPAHIGDVVNRQCEAVYSFVLDKSHVMKINDIECVTLGHGFNEPVVKHSYFGTKRVIRELEKMQGFQDGLVQLRTGCLVRNKGTGLVDGMRQTAVLI